MNRFLIINSLIITLVTAGCAHIDASPELTTEDSTAHTEAPNTPPPIPEGFEPVARYGRYTLISTLPATEQRDLMAQIIDMRIPTQMSPTVKDALNHALRRSGFGLCAAPTSDVQTLFSRPLPAAHYQLGPMTLRDALQTLASPAYQIEVDVVTRNVCFSIHPYYASNTTESTSPAPASTIEQPKGDIE